MEIIFAAERRLLEFRPENKSESVFLSDFPGFIRPKGSGQYFAPFILPVVQNIIKRIKRRFNKPISCPKEVAEMMGTKLTLAELPDTFTYVTQPYEHQDLALRYMYTLGSAGLLLDPGLGKTKVILDYIKLMQFKKSIIVCPRALLFVWEDETLTHQPSLKTYVLKSTSWIDQIKNAKASLKKWDDALDSGTLTETETVRAIANMKSAERRLRTLPAAMEEDIRLAREADVIVVNYDKVSNGVEFLTKALGVKFDFISVDEALIKSHNSKRTLAVTKMSYTIPYRALMSGTLVNNSPMDLYAPLRFLHPGLVGTSYSRFETYYGHMAKVRSTGRKFLAGISRSNVAEMREILEACCIVMDKNVWLKDLPPKKFSIHHIPMTPDQVRVIEELTANYASFVKGTLIEATTPLSAMSKMYQVANGFVYHYPDARNDTDLDVLLLGDSDGSGNGNEQNDEFGIYQYYDASFGYGGWDCDEGVAESPRALPGDVPLSQGSVGSSGATLHRDPSYVRDGLRESQAGSTGSGSDSCTEILHSNPRAFAEHTGDSISEEARPSREGRYRDTRLHNRGDSYSGEHYAEDDGDAERSRGFHGSRSASMHALPAGNRECIRFDSEHMGTNKSEFMGDLLLSELRDRKVLIWYNFTQELYDILEGLERVGYQEAEISVIKGGTKATGDIVRDFNRNPNKKILVCQAQSVNYGITVLGSDREALEKDGVHVLPDIDTRVYTHIFYSLGFSLERFLQQQDRSHRIGLRQSPEYHILLSDCDFEKSIYKLLQDKVDIRDSVLVDVFQRLKSMT